MNGDTFSSSTPGRHHHHVGSCGHHHHRRHRHGHNHRHSVVLKSNRKPARSVSRSRSSRKSRKSTKLASSGSEKRRERSQVRRRGTSRRKEKIHRGEKSEPSEAIGRGEKSGTSGGKSWTSGVSVSWPQSKACGLCSRLCEFRRETRDLTEPSDGADVVLRMDDGNAFYCHSLVLHAWAPHLLETNKLSEEQYGYEVHVDSFPSDVVDGCLRVMYGESPESISAECLEEMMKLADAYQIPDLKDVCLTSAAARQLTVENAIDLWRFADAHDLAVLREKVMLFVMVNSEQMVACAQWDRMIDWPDMLLDLFHAIGHWTVGKPEEPPPPRDTRMDRLWQQSEGLRKPVGHADAKITTKNGATFHVHQSLLTLLSPHFAEWLHGASVASGYTVTIGDFDADAVEEFLRCLYQQEPSERFPELADEVYVLACEYEADSVADLCERQIAHNQLVSIESAIQLLSDAEEHRMPVAKGICFRYLFEHAQQLKGHSGWKQFAHNAPFLISELVADWETYRQLKKGYGKKM